MRPLMVGLLGLGALGYAASRRERHRWHGEARSGSGRGDRRATASDIAAAVGVRRGDRVATIGTDDALVLALASAVGDAGRVYAVALGERRASDLETLIKERGATNLFVVLATPDDPRLPEASIDLALVHAEAIALGGSAIFLDRLRTSLAAGGRVALLGGDLHGRPWFGGEGHRAWHVAQWGLESARLAEVARIRTAGCGRIALYAPRAFD